MEIEKIIEVMECAPYMTSTGEELAKYFEQKLCVDLFLLKDWYLNSIDSTKPPVWTEEHLEELIKDFYLIKKF